MILYNTMKTDNISFDDEELKNASRVDDFSFNGLVCVAKIVDIYDGDTLRAVFRDGNGKLIQYKIRLIGYDSAEMKPLKSDPNRVAIKDKAKKAKEALSSKVNDLVIMKCGNFDKYGRILAYLYTKSGENINQWMMDNHHGIPYDGKTKKKQII